MYNRVKNIVRKFQDLTTLGAANLAGSLISGVFWLFLAPLLGTTNYGEVSYFIAICGIASTVSFLGAGNAITIYTAKGVRIQTPLFFIVTISGLITSVILFFIFYKIGVSLYIIGYVIFGLATSELLGLKLYKSYSLYLIIQKILFVCFAISFYYLMGPQGVILGFALSFLPFSYRLYKEFRGTKINFSIIRPRLGFMINSYVLDLSRSFSGSTDKLIIYPLLGFSLLGNYQLGVQFLSLLSLLPSIVYQYILPHDASGNPNKKLKKITIIVSIGIAFLAILLSPVVIPHLFPKFTQAVTVIQIMSAGIIPLTINLMYISKFLGSEKSKIVLIGSGIYLLTQIPAIFVLGKTYGINGAAAALVLASSAESLFLFLVSHFSKISSSQGEPHENNIEKSKVEIESSHVASTNQEYSHTQSSINLTKVKTRLFNNPIILLVIVATGGLAFRLYYFPWKIPVTLDALSFFWYAMDTSILGHLPSSNSVTHNGWPIVLSFFFWILHSNNFMDYMVLQRIISVAISILTIIPVYLLCSRFVDKRYAILGAAIFAFEPHIIQNSLLGISDSLYILLTSVSLVLFLSSEKKIMYISFSIVALSCMIRIEGFSVFFALSISYFLRYRNKASIAKYFIVAGIFFLVLAPMAFLRIQTTGSDELTGRITANIVDLTVQNEKTSFISHVIHALEMFMRFLFNSMIPIFIFLVPLGVFLIFRNKIPQTATIMITAISMLIAAFYAYFSFALDSRYIFPVFPIFCILSVLVIKELEIKIKRKNIIMILIMVGIISSSVLFLHFKINNEYEMESLSLAYYITNSTSGINPYMPESKYLPIPQMSHLQFPSLSTSIHDEPKLIAVTGFNNLIQYIQQGQKSGLTHLVLDGSNNNPSFLNDVYDHEENYPYLIKIYDSFDHGYKYHFKIFKINYELLESTVKTQ